MNHVIVKSSRVYMIATRPIALRCSSESPIRSWVSFLSHIIVDTRCFLLSTVDTRNHRNCLHSRRLRAFSQSSDKILFGLKIPWGSLPVWVRFPPPAPHHTRNSGPSRQSCPCAGLLMRCCVSSSRADDDVGLMT